MIKMYLKRSTTEENYKKKGGNRSGSSIGLKKINRERLFIPPYLNNNELEDFFLHDKLPENYVSRLPTEVKNKLEKAIKEFENNE